MLDLSIQSHVYGKRQTWICTTWPSFPFPCPTKQFCILKWPPCKNKVSSLNHSKRGKILLYKVAKFYTDVFMVGVSLYPSPSPLYKRLCRISPLCRSCTFLSFHEIEINNFKGFFLFQPWCWIFAKWSQSKAGKIWVHLGPFDIDVRKVTIRYNETNLPKCLRSIN